MSMTVAQLNVAVDAETRGAESGLQRINDHVHKTGGFFKDALSSAVGFAAGGAIMNGVGTAAGFLRDQIGGAIGAFMESERVSTQTTAVLKSTHGAAGMTADAVGNLATKLMNLTGVDDEVVQSAENMLLTFTNIKQDVFPQATETALDMSKALGMDASNASIMLGKALNDPIQGVTALRRVGVQLTDAQQKQVKAFMDVGDIASAQKVILGELQTEVGGSARAYGETLAGKLDIARGKFGNLTETLGGAVAPALVGLMDRVAPLVDQIGAVLPGAVERASTWFNQHISPALERFGSFVQTQVLPVVHQLGEFILTRAVPAFQQLAQWASTTLMPVVQQLAQVISTQVLPALRSIAESVMTNLVPALQRLWEKIAPALVPIFQLLGWVIGNVIGPVIANILLPALGWVISRIADLIPIIVQVVTWFITLGKDIATTVGNILGKIGELRDQVVARFEALRALAIEKFREMVQRLKQFIEEFKKDAPAAIAHLVSDIQSKIQDLRDKLVAKFGELKDAGIAKLGEMKDGMLNALSNLPGKLKDLGTNLIQSLIDGIKNMAGTLANAARDTVTSALSNLPGAQFIMDQFGGKPGRIPKFAAGGVMPQTGLALVGERGPELVALPGGSRVYPTGTEPPGARAGTFSGATINVYPARAQLTAQDLFNELRWQALLYGAV